MSERHKIVIAGAGGMGKAAGLLLRELGDFEVDLYLGDSDVDKARTTAAWVCEGSSRPGLVEAFAAPAEGTSPELDAVLSGAHLLLDCLPGAEAPRMAGLALRHRLHYANLTEYVSETNQIIEMARGADRGFVLQTGLAPGFVNVLGHGLFQRFCREHGVEKADTLAMRVGALTSTAHPPHYYGFTWNSLGVATEYVKPAIVVRDYQRTTRPSLSDRRTILIRGVAYEEDLTSGGAADLPAHLEGRVRNLDYKTLRYPGHYGWVEGLVEQMKYEGVPEAEYPDRLLAKMSAVVPFTNDDLVVVFAAVEGADARGVRHRIESSHLILPSRIGGHVLEAIQSTTTAGLAESARLLLLDQPKGVILQSQIDPEQFMTGPFVSKIYG
jgi:saccharopine dehydrogenase-like NADP-dependent oxidoreductase